ncbi:MAG: Phenylalanine--tRNA ligase beta subunit, partial [Anaerolineae bacterium 49_20]
MKAPLSWIKDYIDLDDLNIEQIAHHLTMVGLEVEGIRLVGLPKPEDERHEFNYEGISWDREKFLVAEVLEVMPHPNADRLVLCRLNDGSQELTILTGAPNLYPYKGKGTLAQPLKVAYAREGAILYDGHQPGQVLTKLKRAVIRGVESFSMICSEKELGISDEHEGVIILDADAPVGKPLVDYMGDAVFDISILPNMVRDASMIGIARELAAVTRR